MDPTRDKPYFDNYRMCRFYFLYFLKLLPRKKKEKVKSLIRSQIQRRFPVRDRPKQADDDYVEKKEKDVDETEPEGKEKADGEVLAVVGMSVDLQSRKQLTLFFNCVPEFSVNNCARRSRQDPYASMLLA